MKNKNFFYNKICIGIGKTHMGYNNKNNNNLILNTKYVTWILLVQV